MNKYQPQSALLSEDEPESRARKWRRSVMTGGALAVIMCLVIAYLNIYRPALSGLNPFLNIEPSGSVPTWIGMLFLGWYVFTSWVFAHIREDIIVADILR
jgi:sterol desaturase/sphingolipid hydroxylase (fatty acid hydroxylase superfamily)